MGIGKALYQELEKELKKMGILNMNACIASPAHPSMYLTDDSIRRTQFGGKSHHQGYLSCYTLLY